MLLALLKEKELPQKAGIPPNQEEISEAILVSKKKNWPQGQFFLTSTHLEKFLHLPYSGISGKVERGWSMFMGNLLCVNLRSGAMMFLFTAILSKEMIKYISFSKRINE